MPPTPRKAAPITVDEKDRFGDTIRLLERAQEDIYFSRRDRELIEKLKAQLRNVEEQKSTLQCPRGHGALENFTFEGLVLERCPSCGGVWSDKEEFEAIVTKIARE